MKITNSCLYCTSRWQLKMSCCQVFIVSSQGSHIVTNSVLFVVCYQGLCLGGEEIWHESKLDGTIWNYHCDTPFDQKDHDWCSSMASLMGSKYLCIFMIAYQQEIAVFCSVGSFCCGHLGIHTFFMVRAKSHTSSCVKYGRNLRHLKFFA